MPRLVALISPSSGQAWWVVAEAEVAAAAGAPSRRAAADAAAHLAEDWNFERRFAQEHEACGERRAQLRGAGRVPRTLSADRRVLDLHRRIRGRRAPHEGQKPQRLELKTISLSWPQSAQRNRRKPCARTPHSRKTSNSSFMTWGRRRLPPRFGRRSSGRAAASGCAAWSAPGVGSQIDRGATRRPVDCKCGSRRDCGAARS